MTCCWFGLFLLYSLLSQSTAEKIYRKTKSINIDLETSENWLVLLHANRDRRRGSGSRRRDGSQTKDQRLDIGCHSGKKLGRLTCDGYGTLVGDDGFLSYSITGLSSGCKSFLKLAERTPTGLLASVKYYRRLRSSVYHRTSSIGGQQIKSFFLFVSAMVSYHYKRSSVIGRKLINQQNFKFCRKLLWIF